MREDDPDERAREDCPDECSREDCPDEYTREDRPGECARECGEDDPVRESGGDEPLVEYGAGDDERGGDERERDRSRWRGGKDCTDCDTGTRAYRELWGGGVAERSCRT